MISLLVLKLQKMKKNFNIAEARINGTRKTRTTGQDKESRPENKTDEQSRSNGTRAGQTSLTGY